MEDWDRPASPGFWHRVGNGEQAAPGRDTRQIGERPGRDINPFVAAPFDPLPVGMRQVMDDAFHFLRNVKLLHEDPAGLAHEEIIADLLTAAFGQEGEARIGLRDKVIAELGKLNDHMSTS